LEEQLSRLTEIPIRVETPVRIESPAIAAVAGGLGGLGGGIDAILSELVSLLERLAEGNSPGAIDLRSLPMNPQDRAELQRVLGDGEVQATVNARGLSRIRETRVSGVWWIEHFDLQGESVAEFIDVSRVPEILARASDEIAADARDLRARIASRPARSPGESHAARQ
jgi:hydrogenase-1 operon protein HyaF